MKKLFFCFVLLSSIYMNAQTTIVEEKFEKDNMPLSYNYLPESDKLIIEKGEYKSASTNRMIKSINKFDISGKKEILAENAELMNTVFSSTENTFMVNEYSRLTLGKNFKYVVNGKSTPFKDISELKNSNHKAFRTQYFNDKYELGFTDEKSKKSIDFKKDQLFLEVTDIFTRNNKRISIEKPDVNRLIGEAYIKPDEDLGFAANIIDNEKLEIVTKSISKDYKTTILYRTNYNMEGKKLNETSFTVSLKDNFLIYSSNGGGFTRQKMDGNNGHTIPIFADDLSINNFYEDNTTGDVYIYGLFGIEAKELNDYNSAYGYYVFKFDKTGKKIWETINDIDDKNGFNKKISLYRLKSGLTIKDNELYFRTGTDYNKEQIHEFFLDKNTGAILNKNKISFQEDKIYTLKGDLRYFLLSFYEYEGYKNKVFDYDGLVAIDTNIKVAQYLKKIDSKNKLYFNTIISNKGIWLLESDNEDYYKVTFFKV